MKKKHKSYKLDGKTMTAYEFYRVAKAKYKWPGTLPAYLIDYKVKDENGKTIEKGCKLNPDAPPLEIINLVGDAIVDMSEEELASIRAEVQKEIAARRQRLLKKEEPSSDEPAIVLNRANREEERHLHG